MRWILGLLLLLFGLALIGADAVVTAHGRVALHTVNVVVALILSFAGGFVIDPAWAGNLIASIATGVGDFFKAKNEQGPPAF